VLDGTDYTGAMDLSVHGLSRSQIATWLEELCRVGIAGWFRDWPDNQHIHAVYCGVPLKGSLKRQVRDFNEGLNGLSGHKEEEFWVASPELRAICWKLYEKANGIVPCAVRSPALAPTMRAPVEAGTMKYHLYRGKTLLFALPVRDTVALCPVREFGEAMGHKVTWDDVQHRVEFDGKDVPLPVRIIDGKAHAPIRKLAEYAGKSIVVDIGQKRITCV
jgi:hypothetical protein